MRLLGFAIAACLVLAILKVSVQIILTVGLVVVVWLAITRPIVTGAWVVALMGYGLLKTYPAQGIALLGGLAVFRLIEKRKARS